MPSNDNIVREYIQGDIKNGQIFDDRYVDRMETGIEAGFHYSNYLEEHLGNEIQILRNDVPDMINTSKISLDQLIAGANNKTIPSTLLPSYVDDVLEYSTKINFPEKGESGKIYVDISTNRVYRWSGSIYVEVSSNDDVSITVDEINKICK